MPKKSEKEAAGAYPRCFHDFNISCVRRAKPAAAECPAVCHSSALLRCHASCPPQRAQKGIAPRLAARAFGPVLLAVCASPSAAAHDGSALLHCHARIGRIAGSPSLRLGLVSRAQAPFPSPSLRSRLPYAPILALLISSAGA